MYQHIALTCAPDTVHVEAVMYVHATITSVPHVVTTPMKDRRTPLVYAKLGLVLIAPFVPVLLHIPGLVQLQVVCPCLKPSLLKLPTPSSSMKI
jgi:hypothetical protein